MRRIGLGVRPAVGLAAVLAVAACSPGSTTGSSAAASAPPSPVVGIVTSVESAGLDQVHGFTLRTSSGQVLAFTVGQLENPTEFPPGHLGEHQVTAEPVKVWFRAENGQLVAYRLADGSADSTSSSGSPGASDGSGASPSAGAS